MTFYETFVRAGEKGSGPWEPVRRMIDVRPGDVLARWKDSIQRGVSTGHTCMIAGMPTEELGGRVRVRVIDSTRKVHADDTRQQGRSGVGAGVMWFVVNDAGEPIGLFVDGSGVRARSTKVAVGRLVRPRGAPAKPPEGDRVFLGLSLDEASATAEQRNVQWRVIIEDGTPRSVGMRLRQDRVNFVLEKGKVIRVTRG